MTLPSKRVLCSYKESYLYRNQSADTPSPRPSYIIYPLNSYQLTAWSWHGFFSKRLTSETHEEKRTMVSTLSHFVQDQRRKPTEKTCFKRSFTRNACYLFPRKIMRSWNRSRFLWFDSCPQVVSPRFSQFFVSRAFHCQGIVMQQNLTTRMMCFYCCLPPFHTYFQSAKESLTWNRSQWPMLCITTIFVSNFLNTSNFTSQDAMLWCGCMNKHVAFTVTVWPKVSSTSTKGCGTCKAINRKQPPGQRPGIRRKAPRKAPCRREAV